MANGWLEDLFDFGWQVVASPLASNLANDSWNTSGNDSPYSSTSLANNSSIGQLYRINEITPGGQQESAGNGSYCRDSMDASQLALGPISPVAVFQAVSPGSLQGPASTVGTPTGSAGVLEKDLRLQMMQRRISSNAFGLVQSQVPTPSSSQQNLTVSRTPPLSQRKPMSQPKPFLRGKSIGHFHSEKLHRKLLGKSVDFSLKT
jgi:hypothetical protein